jgi:Spy/CpxP family protein refolding chaperone
MNLSTKTLMALLVTGAGTALWAANGAAPAPTPAAGPRAASVAPPGGELLRALRQLNLTDDQRAGIRNILSQARSQSGARGELDSTTRQALANPGDPGFAAAVQQAQAAAAARVQDRSQIETQIYNLLTPQQKAQLPAVLSQISAQMQQRRANRGTRAGSTT